MNYHGRRGSAFDIGAQEADIGKLKRILNVGGGLGCFLLHGQGFTGEGRLIQEQVFGEITLHRLVPCHLPLPDDIAGRQHLERYFCFLITSHQRRLLLTIA